MPVDHGGEQHPPDHRHRRQQRHRDRRALAPDHGSRNAIRWTMKPTCANSTSANADDTDRKATSRNACARICVGDGASAACRRRRVAQAPAACRRKSGSPAPSAPPSRWRPRSSRRRSRNSRSPATSSGTPTMPPKLAPFSARLIAMPRFLSNHRPERVGDHAEARAGPAEGEHGIGEIKLPGLAHLTDRDAGRPPSRRCRRSGSCAARTP